VKNPLGLKEDEIERALLGVRLMISAELLDRVKSKLGLPRRPSLDLAGLNKIYAAYSGHVPNDNIQKRIWLAGDKSRPVTGGEPTQFFENWLEHGTGGTCFPANGALCALLRALGFNAWRILGSVMMEGIEHDGNHGTVLVRIDDTDYLVDAQLAAFSALPLIVGRSASTGDGIHDIHAVPRGEDFDVKWYPGSNRQTPMVTRLDLKRGPVDHDDSSRNTPCPRCEIVGARHLTMHSLSAVTSQIAFSMSVVVPGRKSPRTTSPKSARSL
jgi:arylamine N-acetyltransferase